MQPIQYFAYGSNMLRERLLARRVILLDGGQTACANDYKLIFNKKSDDGSAKANLVDESGAISWGVLFSVDPDSLTDLDAAESAPDHYRQETIPVNVAGVRQKAMTYLAQTDKLLPAPASPYDWYLALILAGAKSCPGIPAGWIKQLRSDIQSKPDTKIPARKTFTEAVVQLKVAGYVNWPELLKPEIHPCPTGETMSGASLQSRAGHLLSLARTICHYEEALTQANGEQFNLFDILHVGHLEVRTHSPILAELFNPRGTHGQGAVFLQHFLTQLKIHDFDSASSRVDPEVSIGELGRLDIVITDRNHRSIIIENKIYAGLRENQLKDYHEHNPKANLLFLTLTGEDPADWETNPAYKTASFKRAFQRVSYQADIVRWLESCRKEAATAPGVREAITQYIHLIQRLTHQNTSTRMNQGLTKAILNDKEIFLAYTALCKAWPETRATIIITLEKKLVTIASQLGLMPQLPIGDMSGTYGGFSLSSPLLDQHGLRIYFEFGKSGYRNCYFGFCPLNKGKKPPVTSALQEAFEREFDNHMQPNETWLALCSWSEHGDWDDDTFAAIQFGGFADDLKKLLERLNNVVNKVCKPQQATSNT